MSRCRRLAQILSFLITSLGTLIWPTALHGQTPVTAADPKVVLGQARAAYYNLSARGFRQYRFQARPDWASLLGDLAKTNPNAFEAAMKLFGKVRFEVVVDAEGAAKVSHNEVEAPNGQAKGGMNQVYSGMEQMLTGFFQTWTPFMVQTPFTKVGTELSLAPVGSQYRVRWVESGSTKVDILMDRAYAVTEMKVSSPVFDSVIHPVFERSPGGLALISYAAEYREKPPAPPIRVVVLIKNKPIQGLLVLTDLDLTAWVGDNKTHVLVAFEEGAIEKNETGKN